MRTTAHVFSPWKKKYLSDPLVAERCCLVSEKFEGTVSSSNRTGFFFFFFLFSFLFRRLFNHRDCNRLQCLGSREIEPWATRYLRYWICRNRKKPSAGSSTRPAKS